MTTKKKSYGKLKNYKVSSQDHLNKSRKMCINTKYKYYPYFSCQINIYLLKHGFFFKIQTKTNKTDKPGYIY